jgi:hypothetical protein
MSDLCKMATDVTQILAMLNAHACGLSPIGERLLNMHLQVAEANLLSALAEIQRLGLTAPSLSLIA